MKSNLSQILCSVNKNDLLSMVLLQQIKAVIETFNIVFTVDFSAIEKTFILTPIDKDGEVQKNISINIDDTVYTLTTKQRDLYLILLMAKIVYQIDKDIYNYYSYAFYKEDQYVNLLLLSFVQSNKDLTLMKDNRDLFNTTVNMQSITSTSISKLDLKLYVENIELILSDDLYRYIGYNIKNEPCKGLKTPYKEKTLFGYPFKISTDKNLSLDFFTLKLNDYTIYRHIIVLDMKPYFYLPLHIFEPITCSQFSNPENLIQKGYTLFDYQEFIQLTIDRIFQAITLLNSENNPTSPMWIKNHYKSLSLPFSKN